MSTRLEFARKLLARIGAPTTDANVSFMLAWMAKEGTRAANNPLATTLNYGSNTTFNSVGVRNFADFATGVEATARTILNGRYNGIVANLVAGRGDLAAGQSQELGVWGSGSVPYRLLSADEADTIGATPLGTGGAGGFSGGTVTASSSSDPAIAGAGTTAAPGETPEQYARRTYGYLGWFLDHPEIGPIILEAAANQWDQSRLLGALHGTAWWATTSEQARLWDAELAEDPGEVERQVRARVAEVEDTLGELGIEVDPNMVYEISVGTLRFGIDPTGAEFRNTLASLLPAYTSTSRPGAGTFAQTIEEIKRLATAEYMVGISDADAWTMAQSVIAGDLTLDGVKTMFGQIARGRFAGLGSIFDQGVTPGQFFSSYRNAIASELEVTAEQVDLLDPRWSQVLGIADGKGGIRPMTYSETLKLVRSQPEWERTTKAKSQSATLARSLVEDLGVARF